MIIIELAFIFIIIGIIIKLINIYVRTKENIKKIKEFHEEKRKNSPNNTDNWEYDPETKSFKKK